MADFEAVPQPTAEGLATFLTDQGLGEYEEPVETPTDPPVQDAPVTPAEPATAPTDIPPAPQEPTQEPVAPQTQEPPQQPDAAATQITAVMQAQAQLAESVRLLAQQVQTMQQPPVQQGAAQPQTPVAPAMDFTKLIEIPDELKAEFAKAREDFDTGAEATALARMNAWQMAKADEIRQAAAFTQSQQQAQAQATKNESLSRGYAILSKQYGPENIEAHSQEIVDLMLNESPALKRMLDTDPEAALVSAFEIVNARSQAKIAQAVPQPVTQPALAQPDKDAIIAEYLKAVKDGQPPAVMGNAGGAGRPAMAAPNDLTNLDASMKAWLTSGTL